MNTQQTKHTAPLIDVTALRVNQQGKVLYLFPLNASTIHNLITSDKLGIDRWSTTNEDGYQRLPIDSRYKKFGKFVVNSKGISPVSILLSLRNRDALKLKALPDSDSVFSLRVEDEGQMYIPDGQHRAYGLNWAVNEYPGKVDDYELPVVLFVAGGSDPRYEEAQQFYLINNNAKRTKTDLAQRYVLRSREKSGGPLTRDITIPSGSSGELVSYAVKITDMLNQDGPLKGRIELPNTPSSAASISQASFIDSIKPLLAKASEAHWTIGRTTDIIKAFWSAVKSKCPEAFDHWSDDGHADEEPDHFKAVLATTSGVYILNDILSRSMLLSEVAKAPTAYETYQKLLSKRSAERYFEDGRDGYWSSEDGVEGGAASHGTSRKSFKEVADEMWEELSEST